MKKLLCILYFVLCTSAAFSASSTYMGTSGYQSPQRYYQPSPTGGYYQPSNIGASGYGGGNYSQRGQVVQPGYARTATQQVNATRQSNIFGDGTTDFYLTAGVSHQYAQWNFDMNSAGSRLNYSDIAWNVLDIKGGYKYGDWIIDGGFQYGMQSGKSIMTDDDISTGGLPLEYYDDGGNLIASGSQRVISIGESSGGSMLGFNLGVGLTNKFGFGKTKIVPYIGYRMLNYKLNTANNHGLSVATVWCDNGSFNTDLGNGETYCPAMIWFNGGDAITLDPQDFDGYYWWDTVSGQISSGDTYAFSQTGDTHIYDVIWSGPYLAVELQSEINENNSLNARIELGFPGYESKGDQPYRIDWAHPTSVEDSAPMFGAMHFGLSANWTTMLGKSWGLSFGVTYDYYNVSGADATTHLNGDWYVGVLEYIYLNDSGGKWVDMDIGGGDAGWYAMQDPDTGNPTAAGIDAIYKSCGNSWDCTTAGEVNSFYRSIGIRVGVMGKF